MCWANSPLLIPTDAVIVGNMVVASSIGPDASASRACWANSLHDAPDPSFIIRETLEWASGIVPVAKASRSRRANSHPSFAERMLVTKKVFVPDGPFINTMVDLAATVVMLFPTRVKKIAHFAVTTPTGATDIQATLSMLVG